jgi:hypothetical protein
MTAYMISKAKHNTYFSLEYFLSKLVKRKQKRAASFFIRSLSNTARSKYLINDLFVFCNHEEILN